MRKICLSLILIFIVVSAYAGRTEVYTAAEISATSWAAGDTIVMKNGIWTDQDIELKAEGTAENPVVLMAETPGEVILTGISRLEFSGKHIHISGLYFKDGNLSGSAVISFRTSSSYLADSSRVSNTVIENYNPPLKTSDSKWVSIYGRDNRVDHCSFVNKTNSGTLLVVWMRSDLTPNHTIDHNYFGYRIPNLDSGGKELNGQEIIRIGTSDYSMQTGGCVISDNYFEYCNGEIEVISNKSCENIYTNNLFRECVGMLTLRHGNRCIVDGNYFIGNGIGRTGGVRIIGEDHKVYNNYFENLQGDGYRAALCVVRGKENSALNEYFQVKNAVVAFNTFVDCKQSFAINFNSSSSLNMPPIGSVIAHNHVYNTANKLNVTIYPINLAEMDLSWNNNLMNQGVYSGFTYDTTEIITGVEPSMGLAGTDPDILEPADTSALSDYSTNEYDTVKVDLRGRDRGTVKIPGASQLTGTVARVAPTKETTGASYFIPKDPPATRITPVMQIRELNAYAANGKIYANVSEPGMLMVYDISGRLLHQQRLHKGLNSSRHTSKGLFILRFQSERGDILTRKIVYQ